VEGGGWRVKGGRDVTDALKRDMLRALHPPPATLHPSPATCWGPATQDFGGHVWLTQAFEDEDSLLD